jgi:predicted PurR-regulated permease PerM
LLFYYKGYSLSAENLREVIADHRPAIAEMAVIGIFIMLLGVGLYLGRPILLPILSAFIIGTMLGPVVRHAAQRRIHPWITALALALLLVAIAGAAINLAAAPLAQWISKAPEIAEAVRDKFTLLGQPLAEMRNLQKVLLPPSETAVAVETSQFALITPVVAFVTPTVVEFMLFFVMLLFFLAEQIHVRRFLVAIFPTRDAKLRFLRIANDIERNLAAYVATVTAINVALGVLVALGAWAFGFSNPLIIGLTATVLNYIPYIGPACMIIVLFGLGIVSFPSLGFTLLPPLAFLGLTTLEGQFVTPALIGHRLTLNPLAVLLAIAFWAWIWGPIGAFLAVPITIVIAATMEHVSDTDEIKLPE